MSPTCSAINLEGFFFNILRSVFHILFSSAAFLLLLLFTTGTFASASSLYRHWLHPRGKASTFPLKISCTWLLLSIDSEFLQSHSVFDAEAKWWVAFYIASHIVSQHQGSVILSPISEILVILSGRQLFLYPITTSWSWMSLANFSTNIFPQRTWMHSLCSPKCQCISTIQLGLESPNICKYVKKCMTFDFLKHL